MTQNSKSNLLYFYGEECPHCHRMMPLIEQLEKETGLKLEKYEVWHNEENARLMDEYDKNLCGGVPFFYNTANQEWICGETSYEKLKQWAQV